MNVVILGAGYVGLTTAAALAYLGHRVTCVDVDPDRVRMLQAGQVPIFEPGLDKMLASTREQLGFTTNAGPAISTADVVFIAVGTPPLPDGAPDLRYLKSAAAMIGANLGDHFTVIVNKSTVPIGSGNWVEALVRDALAERNASTDAERFCVASNPEFLREGSALHDSLYANRIVVGCDVTNARDVLANLYRPIVKQSFEAPEYLPRPEGLTSVPFVTTTLASAELIKYSANAFLALKISFINEIAELAERVGADVTEVATGIGLDQRIGSRFLQAGVGWGGSCFGKDTSALISTGREYGLALPIVKAARDVNLRQRERLVEKILAEVKILNGRTVAILGLAFKPDTDDLRDAPAIDIAERLLKRGAKVRAHDPIAMARFRRERPDLAVELCESPEDVTRGADVLLLMTEWAQYQELRFDRMRTAMRNGVFVDARNAFNREQIEAHGFRYLAMGR